MNLFRLGDFTLHSGASSRWKIDCDALSDADLEALAVMLVERLPPFYSVEGVPEGGLRLAGAMQKHRCNNPTAAYLIVDDVLTTGRSMEEARSAIVNLPVVGAVLFARGPCPGWVLPLFTLAEGK